ncbi:MAG: DUF5947 family protein [Candidatus Acidiferrales bacterium]
MEQAAQFRMNQTIGALKRLRKRQKSLECCEVCSRILGSQHPHLVDPHARRIICACEGCALLFEGSAAMAYRRIPRDTFLLRGLEIDAVDWESLSIPIGLAFFLLTSVTNAVAAIYPSPGGPVETELSMGAWEELARRHPRVQKMDSDVEALLVNRLSGSSRCYLTPIDRCYELTGLLRKSWSGFSGGDQVWIQVDHFFARLEAQATVIGAADARPAV